MKLFKPEPRDDATATLNSARAVLRVWFRCPWFHAGLAVALLFLGLSIVAAGAQGTVQFVNTTLSPVTYQVDLSPVVNAPTGTKIAILWGTVQDGKDAVEGKGHGTLVTPTIEIGPIAGVFSGGTATQIPGTGPAMRIWLKVAGWDPAGPEGDDYLSSRRYGESETVSVVLGPATGPGTVIWQRSSVTATDRVKPFTIELVRSSQSIEFPGLPAKTFGDAPFELAAVASSGLPVSYRSSDLSVATIDGSTVTILGAGTTTITASQAGDTNYLAAAEVTHSLVVTPADAQVFLGDLVQRYDGSPRSPSVVTAPPGLSVAFLFDGDSTPPVNAGEYAVVATVQSRNYTGATNGTFTIEKAPQMIAFPEPPRTTVGANPLVLTVYASSGLPVTLTSSDLAVAQVVGNSVRPIGAGSATITATQAGNENYRAAPEVSKLLYVDCVLQLLLTPGGSISASPDQAIHPAGSSVLLTANPHPGYGFIRWEGSLTGSENPASILMDTNKSISAVFASLAVTVGVQGEGAVAKEPDLPYYTLGQEVTLRAQPERWRLFSGWTDGHPENPRTITVGEFNIYTATFVPETPLETVTIGEVTRIAPIGMPAFVVNGTFVVCSNVDVRGPATVSISSTFPGASLLFTVDGSEPGFASALYTGPFVVRRPVILRAVVYDLDFTHAVQSDPLTVHLFPRLVARSPGGGTVSVHPPSGAYLPDGTAVVTGTPDPGWTFLQWLGDAIGPDPTIAVYMNRPRCAEAMFGTGVRDAVVGAGTVVRNPTGPLYPFAEIVRFTAVPQPGNYFAFWANAASGTNNPLSFSVTNANPTVTAVFAALPAGSAALTIIPEGCGRVDPLPKGSRHPAGATVVLTAIPEPGQAFLGWSGDAAGTGNPLTVSMTQSRTITARFTQRPRLTIFYCDGAANTDELQVLITGEYGAEYHIEAGYTPGAPGWVDRGILATPFGVAEYMEPIPRDWKQRIYRAVGE